MTGDKRRLWECALSSLLVGCDRHFYFGLESRKGL